MLYCRLFAILRLADWEWKMIECTSQWPYAIVIIAFFGFMAYFFYLVAESQDCTHDQDCEKHSGDCSLND